MQLGDDLRVHALRSGKAERGVEHERITEFLQRRRIRIVRRAFGGPDHQQAKLAGIDQRLPAGRVGLQHRVLAEHRRVGLGAALERHLRQLDAVLRRDLLHADVQRAARAGRRVGHLAGIGLGVVDHVLPGLERAFGAGRDAERVAGEMDDVGEILVRIPGGLLHQRHAEHRDRHLRDGVAVRLRRRCHRRRSDGAASRRTCCRSVTGWPRCLPATSAIARMRDVGRSACRQRHDQSDRLDRKVLGAHFERGNRASPTRLPRVPTQQARILLQMIFIACPRRSARRFVTRGRTLLLLFSPCASTAATFRHLPRQTCALAAPPETFPVAKPRLAESRII